MINGDLIKQIEDYCKLNNISDTHNYINRILRSGFNTVKYGSLPTIGNPQERIVEKEVIKTVEVEVIKEVEVEVEKIVHVSDDTKAGELISENDKLLKQIELSNDKIDELERELMVAKRKIVELGSREPETKKDIYGDTSEGYSFGSNLKDS